MLHLIRDAIVPRDAGATWTALATITALWLGLLSIWAERKKRRIELQTSPALHLEAERLADTSSRIGNEIHVRIPVRNAAGKRPAEQIEVFLESFDPVPSEALGSPHPVPYQRIRFLPVRLNWCHGGGPVCDRIAGDSARLVNLGSVMIGYNSFRPALEMTPMEPTDIPPGDYEVRLLFVASNMEPLRRRYVLSVSRDANPEDPIEQFVRMQLA